MAGGPDKASDLSSTGEDEARWRALAARVLKGAPFEKLRSATYDRLAIEPLYPASPEIAPRPLGARAGAWEIMARVDHPDPVAANEQALADLGGGATGLHVVFSGSQGAYGFGLPGIEALATVLDGVFLETGCPIEIEPGGAGREIVEGLARIVDRRRIQPGSVNVCLGQDPLGIMAASGKAAAPWSALAPAFARDARAFADSGLGGRYCVADARCVHAAGGSEAQELAFVLAAALAYWRALEGGGFAPDVGRRLISFRMAADADEFLTIGKFRALRRLWAGIEAAAGLAPEPIHIHAETAWRMATRRDPYVNLLRSTVASFAAGIGGADAISVLPFTQALGLPDAQARRLARNTQLILLEEANLGRVADASGGSGGLEALTEGLAREAWSLLQKIEAMGEGADRGLYAALSTGWIQSSAAEIRGRRADNVARRKDAITGTSEFPDIAELAARVVLPLPIEAEVAPTSEAPIRFRALAPYRLSTPFELLRDSADAKAMNTERPQIFLANLGPISAFSARAGFAKALFEAGGLAAPANDGFASAAEAAAAFKASGAKIACLCSSDELYAECAEPTAHALRAAGAQHLYLAARPGADEARWREAGIDGFLFAGCDALALLNAIHADLDRKTGRS